MNFPKNRGTYILVMNMDQTSRIRIGKLGTFDFRAGTYAYVGSAFGSGGLQGRLKHHFSPVKKPHWHIDYLRMHAAVCEVWYVVSESIYEHTWANTLLTMPDASIPAPRFGASDCRCKTHLIYLKQILEFVVFSKQWQDFVYQVDVTI